MKEDIVASRIPIIATAMKMCPLVFGPWKFASTPGGGGIGSGRVSWNLIGEDSILFFFFGK